jgi:CHAT domain-containing protein
MWPTRSFPGWAALLAFGGCVAALMVTAGLLPASTRLTAPDAHHRPELAAFAAAVAEPWALAGRLTGGFTNCVQPCAPRAGASEDRFWTGRLATERLRRELEASQQPRDLGALGSTSLLSGDLEDGIALLEQATALAPDDAALMSDLACAYLSRAAADDRAEDLPHALALAERALRMAPGLLEASFNRAVALERLALHEDAKHAWDDYCVHDTSSGWAEDARRRRDALAARPAVPAWLTDRDAILGALRASDRDHLHAAVAPAAQTARELFEEELLPAWARTQASGTGSHTRANEQLRLLSRVGEALAGVGADHLAADTAHSIQRARVEERTRVARAVIAFDEARAFYDEDRFQVAAPLFETAARQLRLADNPFALRARFYGGLTLFYAQRRPEAAHIFNDVMDAAGRASYFSLLGRALWLRGLMRDMPAGLDDRLADYREAQQAFTRAMEPANVAAVHLLLAETYQLSGDHAQAWDQRWRALQRLDITRDPRRRHVALLDGARACLLQGWPEAALHFDSSLLQVALSWKRAAPISEGYCERARVSLALHQLREAEDDWRQASAWFTRIADPGMARRLEPTMQAARAEIETSLRPAEAQALIDRALRYQREAGRGQYVPALWRLKARAWLSAHHIEHAEAALAQGIDELERQRMELRSETLRRTYVDERWNLYRDMIDLQVRYRRRPDTALSFAERGRARTLLDRLATAAPALDAPARQAVPPGVVVLYFIVMDDRTLMWMLTASSRTFHVAEVTRYQLRLLIEAHRRAIFRRDARASDRLGARLYQLFVRPAAALLDRGLDLIVVPDDDMNGVPFDALRASAADNYLGLRNAIGFAPSLSSLDALSRRTGPHEHPPGRLLALMSSASGPELAPLRAARQEVEAVAALYANPTVVDGADLRKADVIRLFAAADIIHVAVHASTGTPRLPPYLVLGAPARPADERTLSADEIETLAISAKVVVLAACATARGPMSPGEGSLSLALSFLHAGVPTVVASLWDVDDEVTKELAIQFHRALLRGSDPSQALLAAKRALAANPAPLLRAPRSWAGFVIVGASARHGA